jgi:PEGA domain
MRTRCLRTLGVVVAILYLASCATLIHGGGTQTISISTEPPGATVKVGGQDVIAPGEVTLDRNRDYQVIAIKPGYETGTTNISSRFSWVTVLDLIFILPWVVDLVSGSAYNLSPDTVNIVLTPRGTATPENPLSAPAPPDPK